MRVCRRERDGAAAAGAGLGAADVAGQSDHDAPPVRENRLPVRAGDHAARGPGAVGERGRALGHDKPARGGGSRGGGGVGPLPVGPRRRGGAGGRRGGGAAGPQGSPVAGWTALLGLTATVFTAPGYAVFTDLLAGWVLTPGRRTITRMLTIADPHHRRAHDAYHRFIRAGAWSMTALWRVLAVHAVDLFAPAGVVILDCDDTVYKKTGRQVSGAGGVPRRGALHPQPGRPRLGAQPGDHHPARHPTLGWLALGLPINMRVHRKGGPTTVELAAQMIVEITGWLPGRELHLHADGAYATLVGADLPRTVVTSRLRRDAALYETSPTPHR